MGIKKFYSTIFRYYDQSQGYLLVSTFKRKDLPKSKTHNILVHSIDSLIEATKNPVFEKQNIYFTINPNTSYDKDDEKPKYRLESGVKYVLNLQVDLDYGEDGHSKYVMSKEEAYERIENLELEPTVVVHSGHGYHLYFTLNEPILVNDDNRESIKQLNRSLSKIVHGDYAVDLSRTLRVPDTLNYKPKCSPVKCKVHSISKQYYSMDDIKLFIDNYVPDYDDLDLDEFDLSEKYYDLIKHGLFGKYGFKSNSEAFYSSLTYLLLRKNFQKGVCFSILSNKHNLISKHLFKDGPERCEVLFNLSYNKIMKDHEKIVEFNDDEKESGLINARAIVKTGAGTYGINEIELCEYMIDKYNLKYVSHEQTMYRRINHHYEPLKEDIGSLVVETMIEELGKECRRSFNQRSYDKLMFTFRTQPYQIPYDELMDMSRRYISLKNGIFDYENMKLVDHDPAIFTLNHLDFDWDEDAECDLFLRTLDEIQPDNEKNRINIREAFAYSLCRELPIPNPMMFWFIGEGANGKSTLLEVLSSLFGKINKSHVGINEMFDVNKVLMLKNKMVNIVEEVPPNLKISHSDKLKQIISGSDIIGRGLYKDGITFKPYAKHYIAMNKVPKLNDFSFGMRRRIYPIEFKEKFYGNRDNKNLRRQLYMERSGIFRLMMEDYVRLKENNWELTENFDMDNLKAKILSDGREQNNAVFSDLIEKSTGEHTRFKDFMVYYNKYMEELNRPPLKHKEVENLLKENNYRINLKHKVKCILDHRLLTMQL